MVSRELPCLLCVRRSVPACLLWSVWGVVWRASLAFVRVVVGLCRPGFVSLVRLKKKISTRPFLKFK